MGLRAAPLGRAFVIKRAMGEVLHTGLASELGSVRELRGGGCVSSRASFGVEASALGSCATIAGVAVEVRTPGWCWLRCC